MLNCGKNEYLQTAVVILLIVMVVFGFWYGSQAVLNTSIPPALAVVSGSMDTVPDGTSSGWLHPFSRTLQIGDLIIIQGVSADTLYKLSKQRHNCFPDQIITVSSLFTGSSAAPQLMESYTSLLKATEISQ